MFSLLKSMALGSPQDDVDVLCRSLRASDVPVSTADCRACSDPCDLGHEAYPRRFDVDFSSKMLGSVKPYHRQVVISTGKSDWDHNISDEKDSLAAALSEVAASDFPKPTSSSIPLGLGSLSSSPKVPGAFLSTSPPRFSLSSSPPKLKVPKPVPANSIGPNGLFTSADSARVSILNGSHRTLSCDEGKETVLVFPDYLCVSEVTKSIHGARDLWKEALKPELEDTLKERQLKTWVLPYACVILLCSHKKRDNRCGIAAPKLEHAFIKALEAHGWEANVQLEHPELTCGPALEDLAKSLPTSEAADIEAAVDVAASGIASIELEPDFSAPISLELSDSGYAEAGPPLSETLPGYHGRTATNRVQKVVPPLQKKKGMTTKSSSAIPISKDGKGVQHAEDKNDTDAPNGSRMATIAHQLKESASSKRALIVKVSHIGGHKYAGNAIIYQPSGSGIWYGRVTPHDVDSIVENTIIEGLILPPLLRGGLNLARPNCKTLNDW